MKGECEPPILTIKSRRKIYFFKKNYIIVAIVRVGDFFAKL